MLHLFIHLHFYYKDKSCILCLFEWVLDVYYENYVQKMSLYYTAGVKSAVQNFFYLLVK